MLENDPVIKNRLEIITRNKNIQGEFENLKKQGYKISAICELLSDKYFTGISNIKRIVYELDKEQKN